jgi:mono/diheme cytochrome c family protein
MRLTLTKQLFFRAATATFLVIATALLVSFAPLALPSAVEAQDQPSGPMGAPSPVYDPAQVTVPLSSPMALAGSSIYQDSCAPCHGAEGLGNGPTAKDLSGPPTAFADPTVMNGLSPAQMFFTTKYGRMQNMMPPWGQRLDDSQIWDAVAFAWSLRTQQSAVAAGQELYNASCASCHGETGKGDGPETEGTIVDFSDQQYSIFQSQADWQSGWQAEHPQHGQEWSAEDRDNVLEYIRTFSYLPPWESSYKPGSGVITGTVVQGTRAGSPIAELPVVLEAFVGFSQVASFTSTVSAGGVYTFENLATDPSIAYVTSVGSDNISYSSDFVSLTPITPTVQSPVTVFDTTDDPSNIKIGRAHWIMDHQPGALLVGEIYTFGNSGDRAFVGRKIEGMDEPGTLELHVPEGAAEITFDNGALGDRFQQVGNTIYDTLPVIPGSETRQIVLRYAIPYNGTSIDIKQDFAYPVDQLSLLIADVPQLEVEAPELESGGVQDLQGQAFQIWRKAAFEPQTININMQGLLEDGGIDPRAAAADAGTSAELGVAPPPLESWAPWVMMALVGAGLLAAVGVAMRRNSGSPARAHVDQEELRSQLLGQIALLDDQHALGQVSDADWSTRRAYLKSQLINVMQKQEM